MHELLDTDVEAFLKFGRATGLHQYRKDVPLDVYFAATLTASSPPALASTCAATSLDSKPTIRRHDASPTPSSWQ